MLEGIALSGALERASRGVLVLRDVEGRTASEVAEIVGPSAYAVKSRLHRVRGEVRATLERASAALATAACTDVVTLFSRYFEGEIARARSAG